MTITKLRRLPDGSIEHYTENTTPPTVEQATAMVRATCERLEKLAKGVTGATKPAERVVTREFLTPRKPGASSSEVTTVAIPKGTREARQYAQPTPHFDAAHAARITAEDELAKLKILQKDLQALIADPATSDQARVKAQLELVKVTDMVARLETALNPVPQAGDAPTAGNKARQFARPTPHWEKSDAKGGQ